MEQAYFERFTIALDLDDARSGSHCGRCDDDIAALLGVDYIKVQLAAIDPDLIRDELAEFGAWDELDLADHDQNLARILWIACGNIQEEAA